MSLPAILYVKDLRRLLDGWDDQRVRRHLKSNDLGTQDANGDWFTTVAILQEKSPVILQALEAKWAAVMAGAKFDPDDFDDLRDVGD